MSFVKTKWRIIELSDTVQIDSTAEESYKSRTLGIYFISPKDIIQPGFTVKELCDEFVIDNKLIDIFDTCFQYQTHRGCFYYLDSLSDQTIYGAIWTPEGLKYVAKMNEKGEFVLYDKSRKTL